MCDACPAGQSGYNCEIMEQCNPNPCQNGGTCTQVGADDFLCSCQVGFLGDTCEFIDLCSPSPCYFGTCSMDGNGGYSCACDLGYLPPDCQTFSFCQTELNSCVNGDCTEDGFGYSCNCYPGWIGPDCATSNPCDPNPCAHSGSCDHDGSVHTCSCTTGYMGDNCEITDICNPAQGESPCKFGALCSQTGTFYMCDCLQGTSGSNCDVFDDVCPFETEIDGRCPLNQDSNDNFDWTRQTGPSGTSGTGPTAAAEGQYYMLADSSGVNSPNNKRAVLVGNIDIASTRCLKFRYKMYGLQVKKLAVTRNGVQYWSEELDRGENWHSGAIDLGGSSSPVEVKFIATLGKGGQSDIAIDDVVLLPQPCGPCDDDVDQPCYLDNACIPQGDQSYTCDCQTGFEGLHCDTVDIPLTCDFEDITQCFLKQGVDGTEDVFDWTLNSQPLTPSGGTGPNIPTVGIHYMFIEASGKSNGDYALLTSPVLKAGDWCLSWKYSMYGRHIGRLSILVRLAENAVSDTEVWYKEGNIGNRNWHPESITLTSPQTGQDFRFAIKGTRADGYKGDMALDDVQLTTGSC